jgi:transcriptional regulator with XRE-family HTH domain
MAGPGIKYLREALGLDPYVFAKILGVHVSTLYRWEQTRGEVRIDPLQADILEKLRANLAVKKRAEQKQMGEAALQAVLVGGALVGLAFLLNEIVKSGGGGVGAT